MNPDSPRPPAAGKPFVLRWLAWGRLILMGGTVVTALVSTFVSVAKDGPGRLRQYAR